jgi:hypothetical protein
MQRRQDGDRQRADAKLHRRAVRDERRDPGRHRDFGGRWRGVRHQPLLRPGRHEMMDGARRQDRVMARHRQAVIDLRYDAARGGDHGLREVGDAARGDAAIRPHAHPDQRHIDRQRPAAHQPRNGRHEGRDDLGCPRQAAIGPGAVQRNEIEAVGQVRREGAAARQPEEQPRARQAGALGD